MGFENFNQQPAPIKKVEDQETKIEEKESEQIFEKLAEPEKEEKLTSLREKIFGFLKRDSKVPFHFTEMDKPESSIKPGEIFIDGEKFNFRKAKVLIGAGGYSLLVTEKGFDESTENLTFHETSVELGLPSDIKRKIKKVPRLNPVVRMYEDAKGNKKLDAYFD